MSLDLASMTTEGVDPRFAAIDTLPAAELVALMNREDATVAGAVATQTAQIAAAAEATVARLRRGGRLVYAGAGTAGRLGVLDAAECPPTFATDPGQVRGLIAGGPAALTTAVEGAEDDGDRAVADLQAIGLGADDVLVGISASGRTPYAVAAVRHGRAVGACTVGLACNAGSALAAAADIGIEVVVGPEVLAGSTRLKAGTAQKMVLNQISTAAMVGLGKTYGNLMVDVRATNQKLRARARRIVALATGAPDAAVDAALTANGGEAKRAILAILGGLGPDDVVRRLAAHDGSLRRALDGLPDAGPTGPGHGGPAPTGPRPGGPAPTSPGPTGPNETRTEGVSHG
ncbi:N-acetylmuramic acid 6-phosphate etherase [Georgenia sp. TF02-10]|uniref:N-acetylmuramic acid 6-phosphate etherase n=1 Tax=Georgenia sp. TF02-10 TaxID=2917725 RepID=UPI001FA6C937|nr:N-acetylmuramic acid 6-phosphate etherase [Georgenia sp. TF02-10]UNX53405.1 N-acetylmuramic acid 6-phosphate etherase [Georgenia sp. TF02-10]